MESGLTEGDGDRDRDRDHSQDIFSMMNTMNTMNTMNRKSGVFFLPSLSRKGGFCPKSQSLNGVMLLLVLLYAAHENRPFLWKTLPVNFAQPGWLLARLWSLGMLMKGGPDGDGCGN